MRLQLLSVVLMVQGFVALAGCHNDQPAGQDSSKVQPTMVLFEVSGTVYVDGQGAMDLVTVAYCCGIWGSQDELPDFPYMQPGDVAIVLQPTAQ